jgi:hypothetical protein
MEKLSKSNTYKMIYQNLKFEILSGRILLDERLKSTRELATIYKVNPNTMQKALKNLENDNLIYTLMISGRYVTNDAKYIQQKKSEEVKEIICIFFRLIPFRIYLK